MASKARTDEGLTPKEAVARQRELALRVAREDAFGRVTTVAGSDASVRNGRVHAVIAVFSFPELEWIETARHVRPVTFPYVPGLLGFREVPALRAAFGELSTKPDLVLVDGHGLAHPRRFGIACHLGVELDLPTIGCGKTLLCGEHRTPGPRRGARTRLLHKGEVVGSAVRTRERVKPLYVSIGHRCSLASAVRLVLACTRGTRLPEPIRVADREAGRRGRALPEASDVHRSRSFGPEVVLGDRKRPPRARRRSGPEPLPEPEQPPGEP